MSLAEAMRLSRRKALAVGRAAQFSYFPPPRCEMADEKAKLLEAAISQIEKSHGKGAIMRLGSRDVLVPVSVIPTGCLSLDAALGVGGFPRGRVVEVYGPESGGKTTMTLHVIAEAQKLGGTARPQGRARRRYGRSANGSASATDVASAAQAHGYRLQVAHLSHLHQSDPRKNRRHVRQSGNHHRWPRAEVLRLYSPGYSPHSSYQGRRPRDWFAHARQSREEQSGRAFP